MPKTVFTKREDLICGKIDLAHEAIRNGNYGYACDILELIRYDAERMEQKLISRKIQSNEKLI